MPFKTNATNHDPKQSNAQLVIADFKGLAPSQDPHSQDPALAAIQVNCYAVHPGQLTARKGMQLVTFAT